MGLPDGLVASLCDSLMHFIVSCCLRCFDERQQQERHRHGVVVMQAQVMTCHRLQQQHHHQLDLCHPLDTLVYLRRRYRNQTPGIRIKGVESTTSVRRSC